MFIMIRIVVLHATRVNVIRTFAVLVPEGEPGGMEPPLNGVSPKPWVQSPPILRPFNDTPPTGNVIIGLGLELDLDLGGVNIVI